MQVNRLLSLKTSVFYEFLFVFGIALLVRGNGIFGLSWSCDDLLSIADPSGVGYASSQASQLRIFASLTTRLVGWLGAGFPPLGAFWNASHTASMVVFALALRRLWIPGSASVYGILIGLLFTLFPYHINLLSFQLQHPSMVMSYLSGAYGLCNYDQSGWRRWLSVLALAMSLSYQTMISYYLAAAIVMFLVLYFQRLVVVSDLQPRRSIRPFFDYVTVLVLGVLAYLGLSVAAVKLSQTPISDRTTFASGELLPSKLQLIINHLKRTAYGQEPSVPRSAKLLQSTLWLIVSAGLGLDLLRSKLRMRGLAVFLPLVLVASACLVAAAFLPTILMDHTSENPRNLLATVLLAAGFLALSTLLQRRSLRLAALALAGLIAVSYAITTNTLSVDLARLTTRDLLLASRMVERLDQQSEPNQLRTVVVVGRLAPGLNLRGREYYQSAFEVPWAQVPILNEASGHSFTPPGEADRQAVQELARNRPAWPAPESVAVKGDVGLIVLSKP